MKPELIIYTNKQVYKRIALIMFIMLIFVKLIFLFIRYTIRSQLLGTIFQGTLVILGLIICIALIYSLYRIMRNRPMAVINAQGIWIQQFGVIAWSNIQDVKTFLVAGTPTESIGIQVHDTDLLAKQANLAGKLIILESKVLHTPTIVIDNIELDNQTIIDFANQFMQ